MTTNDSKDQGREAFNDWWERRGPEAVNHKWTEDACWFAWQAALATSASAISGSEKPISDAALKRFGQSMRRDGYVDAMHEFKHFHRTLCERVGYVHDDRDWQRDQLSLIEWIAAAIPNATSASALARDEVGELCARCNCWVRPSDDCNLCRSADDAKPVGEAVSVALSDERIIDIWCNTPTTRFGGEVEDQEIIDFARDEASVSEGWTSVEERLPKFPSTVLVAYESDADGEPCLDTGEAILHADGKWYGLGVFYALGREPRYEPRLTEKKVVCWKPMPSYSAPHATETVEMTDNSGWYEMAEWAVERWNAEVKNRPLINVHRRSLDDVWRQVIRHCGGDPDVLIGPNHDALLAASSAATVSDATSADRFSPYRLKVAEECCERLMSACTDAGCPDGVRMDDWIREVVARAASSATAPLTSDSESVGTMDADEWEEFERTVEDFEDCGETSTDYEVLMDWAQRGLLECTHFEVTKAGQDLIARAQSTNGEQS
jgi:hypothetical protein